MGHQVRRDQAEQSEITDDAEKRVGKNRTKDNARPTIALFSRSVKGKKPFFRIVSRAARLQRKHVGINEMRSP